MKNDFSFNVSYTVNSCNVCPHFCNNGDYPPSCTHIFGNGLIQEQLDNDYYLTIHKDCPMREVKDNE
jgi:hypothetical protein